MANIKLDNLSKLNLSGADLFDDSESFLTELNDENEQMGVVGGSCWFASIIGTRPKCCNTCYAAQEMAE
jgi:hypothetical protein